jgi:truncated hemoglobin YjbI
MPFAIDEAGANAWMLCMETALLDCEVPYFTREFVGKQLRHLAHHMRNVDHPADKA